MLAPGHEKTSNLNFIPESPVQNPEENKKKYSLSSDLNNVHTPHQTLSGQSPPRRSAVVSYHQHCMHTLVLHCPQALIRSTAVASEPMVTQRHTSFAAVHLSIESSVQHFACCFPVIQSHQNKLATGANGWTEAAAEQLTAQGAQ